MTAVSDAEQPEMNAGEKNPPSGWLHDSCGFCVYFVSSTSRTLLSSCT
jgi:hypothetical protein